MRLKFSIAAGSLGLMAVAFPMQAQALYDASFGDPGERNLQCERQRADNSATGTVVGAIAGALIGGAIGNNIEADRTYTRYDRRGRPVGRYTQGRSESGNVAAGAVLGALLGAAAGNSIAKDSGPGCAVAYAPGRYSYPPPGGQIPRTTKGLYGGPEVMGASHDPADYPSSYGRGPDDPSYPGDHDEARGPGPARDCRVIQRETRLPDGGVLRDPVTACWDEQAGQWHVQDVHSYGD